MSEPVEVVRRLFKAVEARDLQTMLDCYDEQVEINEADSLPYGGAYHGHDGAIEHAIGFLDAWDSLQGDAERKLDASFFASEDDDEVAVLFRHRALDQASGRRIDSPEVSLYEVRNGKVVRSRMFHADSAAVVQFLADVRPSSEVT
jgi:ketosteroid isomerase-like protein